MRNKKLLLSLSVCSSLILLPFASYTVSAEQANPQQAVRMVPATFADLAEALSPAVVNVSTTQKMVNDQNFPEMPQFPEGSPFQDFFNEFMERRGGGIAQSPSSSLGSGFIIDSKNGYIVTNNHVVRDADDIRITLSNDITLKAELIGEDEKTDIAVLKVNPKEAELTSVSFGDSDSIRVGDWTLAIGNPFGLGGSVTSGIISARARDIHSGPYDDYLQTDAAINRGNSGGPLFDLSGSVIGINTAIFSPTGGSIGIGFAIPSNMAKHVVNQIIKYGRTRRGWIGVQIQSVTDDIAETLGLQEAQGALIADVVDGSPAGNAGLKSGDIILEFNGQKIQEMRSLPRIVAENDIDTSVTVKFWRDEKEQTAQIKIGELEEAEKQGLTEPQIETTGAGTAIETFGLTVAPLDETARKQYGISSNVSGVVITQIDQNAKAIEKGITPGDVIVEINQRTVENPEDVIETLKNTKRKSVLLLINSVGTTRFVALEREEN